MDRRAYSSPLRGVKRGVVALSILMLSLSSTVFFPRPAHAEGFLGQTVRCVLGVLVLKDCRTPAPQPGTPLAPASPVAPSSPPAGSQNVQPAHTPDASRQTPVQEGGTAPYIQPAQPETLDTGEVETTTPPVPDLPKPSHRQSFTYEPTTYVAYRYGAVKGEQTVAQAAVIEPTREGWRFLGVAWYWWAIGAALIAAGFIWRKKRNHKEILSIVK